MRKLVCVEYLCEESFTKETPDEIRWWVTGILVSCDENGVQLITKVGFNGQEYERIEIQSKYVISVDVV